MNLIYFFPGVLEAQAVSDDRLRSEFLAARKVAPALATVTSVRAQTCCMVLPGKGPGGHSGLLLCVIPPGPIEQAPPRIGYYPDFQVWHERPAGADCWVGVDREHPPTPAEMAHLGAAPPKGYPVVLGDGHTWRVPIVRCPFSRDELGRSHLPREFGYDADGKFTTTRGAAHDELWELSALAWDHAFARGDNPTLPFETVLELCLLGLAVNYRVGKVEQQVLKLVNSDNWERIVESLLDIPLVNELVETQKKTTQGAAPG